MGVIVTISEEAKAQADALVLSGRFESVEQALEAGLRQLDDAWGEEIDLDDLSAEDRAAVEEGLADIEAGCTIPADEVFAELRARYSIPKP